MADTRVLFLTDRQYSTLCFLIESASLTFDSDMANSQEVIDQFYDDYNDLTKALDQCLGV